VLHTSGQERTFGPLLLPAGDDNKQTGGSITSARRFAIMAALGFASVGEDHGDEGGDSPPTATARQLAKISGEIERGRFTAGEVEKALEPYGVGTTAELNRQQASHLIDRLVPEADRRIAAAAAGANPATGEVKS
jgi:hypothetical protein